MESNTGPHMESLKAFLFKISKERFVHDFFENLWIMTLAIKDSTND